MEAMETNPTNSETPRLIIKHIADAAIELAFTRHELTTTEYEEGEFSDVEEGVEAFKELVEEVKADVLACLTGDEAGCLDPEDIDYDNELEWLKRQLASPATLPTGKTNEEIADEIPLGGPDTRANIEAALDAAVRERVGSVTLDEIIQRISDPGSFLQRGDNYNEPIISWGARAVMDLLQKRNTGSVGVEEALAKLRERYPDWGYMEIQERRGRPQHGEKTCITIYDGGHHESFRANTLPEALAAALGDGNETDRKGER